jgi:hypothetical protein
MNRLAPIAGLVAALALPQGDVLAGAWTQEAGSGQVINSFTFYALDQQFDSNRDLEDRGRFTKLEYSPYIEYGVTDRLTLGAQPFFQALSDEDGPGERDNAGLADVELFARQRLWKGDNAVLSVQGLVSVPGGYDPDADLPLGRDQVDVEGRVLWGAGYDVDGIGVFYDLSAAYRKRFDDPGDEVSLDVTLGVKPWSGWQVLIQSFNTIGVDNADGTMSEVRGSDLEFDRYKLQVSVVRDITDSVALQAGAFSEFAGRNTGQGNAGFVALWFSF